MGNSFAEHCVVYVGVGVNVDHADGSVFGSHSSKDWKGDGVIAADGDGLQIVLQQAFIVGGDSIDRIGEVVGIGGNVASVVDSKAIERGGPGRHVVRTQQDGFVADGTGPEPRPWAVRCANVEGNSDHRYIEIGRV